MVEIRGKLSYENDEKVIQKSDFHMGNPSFGRYAEQLIHQQQGQMLNRKCFTSCS